MGVFSEFPTIRYEGKDARNPLAFRYYDADRVVAGKTMREHLRFSMSYWHTMCADLKDMFGDGTLDREYGRENPMEIARAKADAAFEFMQKLGIGYFCFHDADIAPVGRCFEETRINLSSMVDYIEAKMKENDIRLLWGTANLFNHPRYMHGAGTSCCADSFAYAAAQVKNALDATIRLKGKAYLFWGGREGYETLLNTDMELELDNMSRLLRMTVDYGRKKGFAGDFFIEPKPKEPMKHQYDFDASTVLAFLQKYDLIKDFKLNIEANHATLAGHTFQHELQVARINGVLGSIDANQGDALLGWDTDQFPSNVYDATLCMYEVLKNGGLKSGGLNFDAKVRRPSCTYEDIFYAYICGMDAMAFGLLKAAELIEDGRIEEFVRKRYMSYRSGIGAQIVDASATLESLETYVLRNGEPVADSGRQEGLESVFNQILLR